MVLITGAGSGLGKALSILLSSKKARVVMVSRDQSRLDQTTSEIEQGGGIASSYQFDLGDISQIPDLHKKIVANVGGAPTILLNVVGYQVVGLVGNTPTDVFAQNYRVNLVAPVSLIQCVLPSMVRNGRGIIANVMSSIMYRSFPGVSSYCASKRALGAVHESLKSELEGTGVKTLYIRPGSFKSRYWENTDVGERIQNFIAPSIDGFNDPENVAKRICLALEVGDDRLCLDTYKDKIGRHMSYWCPRLLDRVIDRKNRYQVKV